MTNSVFRHAAGGLAGALAALSASLTYAATLNQNLQTRPEMPPSLVAAPAATSRPLAPSQAVLVAEAKKPLPGIKPAEPQATAAEIVGKLLAPGSTQVTPAQASTLSKDEVKAVVEQAQQQQPNVADGLANFLSLIHI